MPNWTQEELQNASKAMKAAGHLGYEEFCEQLDKTIFTAYCKNADNNLITICVLYNCKELEKQLQEHFNHLKVITVLSEDDIAFIKLIDLLYGRNHNSAKGKIHLHNRSSEPVTVTKEVRYTVTD